MAELTQTGLYFAPDGTIAIKVHREEGLTFDAFPTPVGWARIIISKADYDTCVLDADLYAFVAADLQLIAPDIAAAAAQRYTPLPDPPPDADT
jgi:hypothetical protein